MSQYKINTKIPNTMNVKGLGILAALARNVPENGVIVEVGSLFGCSTWVLAQNSHPSVKVYAIDPWERAPWIIEIEKKTNAKEFSKETFQYYTRDCDNVFPIQGYSPDIVEDSWNEEIDLFFEDSTHSNPVLTKNFNFFIPFVKEGGIISGDDYARGFVDVVNEVDKLSEKYQQSPYIDGSVWALRKTSNINQYPKIEDIVLGSGVKSKVKVTSQLGRNFIGAPNSWSGALHKCDPIKSITVGLDSCEESDLTVYLKYELTDGSVSEWIDQDVNYTVPEGLFIKTFKAKLNKKANKKFNLRAQACFVRNDADFNTVALKKQLFGNSKEVGADMWVPLNDENAVVSAVKLTILKR